MKIYSHLFISILSGLILLSACNQGKEAKKVETEQANNHQIEILDVIQSSSYSYLLAKEKLNEYWLAVDRIEDVKAGDVMYYVEGMEMRNLESKELGKTFDLIYFVDHISSKPIDPKAEWFKTSHNTANTTGKKAPIIIEPYADGLTIENLYANKEQYKDKKVRMKGIVVRFNEKIMDTNWVHLQDGSGNVDSKNHDLTITTSDVVAVNDTVVFEGILHLDKDFSAGYFYSVIIEEAKLVE